MSNERFDSIWDAIENTPAEAENLRLLSALMISLKQWIERQGWIQGSQHAISASRSLVFPI